ncbi:hypothetical protein EYF80_045145 [Liparis tanakae]|uniref:Uncharacterized protein n=1 Tax=Liparis tanakae TaxID=230148 RepID=A0A4Z2FU57_9TELE|nr:hypothetical protein EYF80_045145 [Liparis tanakae]
MKLTQCSHWDDTHRDRSWCGKRKSRRPGQPNDTVALPWRRSEAWKSCTRQPPTAASDRGNKSRGEGGREKGEGGEERRGEEESRRQTALGGFTLGGGGGRKRRVTCRRKATGVNERVEGCAARGRHNQRFKTKDSYFFFFVYFFFCCCFSSSSAPAETPPRGLPVSTKQCDGATSCLSSCGRAVSFVKRRLSPQSLACRFWTLWRAVDRGESEAPKGAALRSHDIWQQLEIPAH